MPVALATVGTEGVIAIGRGRVIRRGRGRGRVEQVPRAADRRAPLPVGEQAEVANPHEAPREHMEQEPPQKLVDVERHDLRVAAMRVVLPPPSTRLIRRALEIAIRCV